MSRPDAPEVTSLLDFYPEPEYSLALLFNLIIVLCIIEIRDSGRREFFSD